MEAQREGCSTAERERMGWVWFVVNNTARCASECLCGECVCTWGLREFIRRVCCARYGFGVSILCLCVSRILGGTEWAELVGYVALWDFWIQ